MSVNTPHKARELVKGFPDALTSEILDRATQLKVVKNELRWKAKNANPVDNRLIFDAAGYLKFLRAEYFDEYMEVNRDLKDAEAINDLMGLLYDYEKSADVVDDGAPSPISWNASSMCVEQTARNGHYWQLTERDFEFLRYIRLGSSDNSGSRVSILYVRSHEKNQTYVPVGPLSGVNDSEIFAVLSSVKTKTGTLLEDLETEYRDYVHEIHSEQPENFHLHALGMIKTTTSKDGVITPVYGALKFRDYIKFSLNYLNHSRFRLRKPPVTMSNKKSEPAFLHFNPNKLKEGSHEAWSDWLHVIPEEFRPAFRAWVYSIFVAENMGRQALWLHSAGYDGKSQVINAITEYMGGVGVGAVNTAAVSSSNKFAYSNAYGKRFLVFADCQNNHFMHQNFTHAVLGGDPAPVEYKGKEPFMARLFCKFMIGSNKAPMIDVNAMHELTRLIYIPLQRPPKEIQKRFYMTDDQGQIVYDRLGNPHPIGYKGTKSHPELKDALLEEMDAFLFTCRKDYRELCPNDKEIYCGEFLRGALYNACISTEADIYQKHIESQYEFTKDGDAFISLDAIRGNITKYLQRDRMKWFKSYRVEEYVLTLERIGERRLNQMGKQIAQYKLTTVDGERGFTNIKPKKDKGTGKV